MKKPVRLKRFSSRIRAVVIIVTAVTLFIYNIICYASAKKILEEDFFSRSDIIMEKTNEKLGEYMDEFSVNMGLVAESEILCNSLESGTYDGNVLLLIQNLAAMDRYIQNVEIYNKDLKIFYRVNNNTNDVLKSDIQKVFNDLSSTDKQYKTLFIKSGEDGYKLSVCRAITQNDSYVGYMIVDIDCSQIVETFESASNFVSSKNIYIIDSENNIVSAESGKLLDGEYFEGKGKLEVKGSNRFGQYEIYEAKVEKLDMSILTLIAPTYVLKQLYSLAYQNIFISIVILVLCVLGAVSLGKSISEPIKEVKSYIEENILE
ncbi:MAG: cache domain-containing protein [Clostridia bacterium]|nr:cache domain-containing protein [Clostridia bacterium]